jgi:hypothetical protein
MAGKEIVPQLGPDSYSCPHCGALAHQFWFHVYPEQFKRDEKPIAIQLDMIAEAANIPREEERARTKFEELHERFLKNEVTYEALTCSSDSYWRMINMVFSRCHACDGFSVWIKDKLAWPAHTLKIDPHSDIPANVKDDFIEAVEIVEKSPRGSAALSRLIVQKLMIDLGESGKDLNADIASLVKKGLEPEIQKALDIVRVTGNNAVHPGQIDLTDDAGTALALLQLINLVVERRIATQKRINEMFANLPPGALEQIERRDAPKQLEDKSGSSSKSFQVGLVTWCEARGIVVRP